MRASVPKAIVWVVVVLGLLVMAGHLHLQRPLRSALAWIAGLGPLGVLWFVGLYVAACVLLIPGSILTLGAGVVFGILRGSIVVSIAATLGAGAAFLVGRYLARDWVARRIAGNARFIAVDEAVAREGWKIVLLARLSPVLPFNLLNYGFGLTKVSFKAYLLASWAGMIPGTILYVYIGSLAGSLANVGGGARARGAGEWILYGVGLAATVVVTIFVTRLARAALGGRIPN